ncbi:MAG TPA: ABC transporter permease subunit [Verrucomicrobiae bacterium]
MTFLPVVERELRTAGRRRATYGSRMVVALLGWAVAIWILLGDKRAGSPNGAVAFEVLAVLLFAYAALGGLLATSDCVSEEKRDGTLGLLFLTDLKGYDVVFGKLVSTSLKSIHGVLAVAPALAISIIMGAVTQGEVVRAMLVALNLLFFFLSVGLFASAVCRQDNRSLGLAVLMSAAALCVIPAAARLRFLHLAHPSTAFIFSPAFGCFAAFESLYNKFPHWWFWVNLLLTQVCAWSLLAWACRIVPRSWQDASSGRAARRRLVRVKSRRGQAEQKEALAVNVFLWRASAPATQRTVVWLALLAVALLRVAAEGIFTLKPFDVSADLLALVLAGGVLKIWLASEASATLSADRRNAALELLLTTPLLEADILKGQRMALWRQFAEPAAAVFMANMAMLIGEMLQLPEDAGLRDRGNLLVGVHLIVAGSVLVDLLALSWVAMWQGLLRRKPNRAAFVALLQILFVPYVLCAMLSGGTANGFSLLIFTNIIGLASEFLFAKHANTRLAEWFRRVVADGMPPKLRMEEETAGVPALEGAE